MNSKFICLGTFGSKTVSQVATVQVNTAYFSQPRASPTLAPPSSSMLAVACDDFVIRIVDTDTRRIVRVFSGHTNRITDQAFSADSRWLITSSVDCTIRTWDLPSGRCGSRGGEREGSVCVCAYPECTYG